MPKTRRSKCKKTVKSKLWIYCEGKTERTYLIDYIRDISNNELLFELPNIRENTAESIINRIIIEKGDTRTRLATDEYWAVYDRESPSKYSDELHSRAYNKAKKHNIFIAISNVCFEQWLLLHFSNSCASYESFDDLISNSSLKQELKSIEITDYKKGDAGLYAKLKEKTQLAIQNAKFINESAKNSAPLIKNNPYQISPYTDFYLLLESIRNFKE